MSVELHQFLDNSGGSNFTEHAPRPPCGPGEENELHSTGGHSNKSSGSHKSLTSNRSNGSGTGGATPRRSQKPAKLPPTTATPAVVQTPTAVNDAQQGGEHEAPLGFEPEGSVDEKPEFTESNSPSYTKWAESLDYLLEDADGVTLFKKYLSQENSVNLFEFYFAWKYLQQLEDENSKGIVSLVKTMNKIFIKGGKGDKRLTLVSKETKDSIAKLVESKQYSKTIFDSVKDQVIDIMKREFYIPFLKSDIYLQYIQSIEDSPKESANSSGSISARPLSTVLQTVHEDSELDLRHVSSVTDNVASDGPVLTLTVKNMKMTERLRQESKIKPEDQAGYYLQKSGEDGSIPPHPYHTYNTSYLPISAIDSERQSLSSEALTDDTHSITDSSVDGFPQYTNRRSVHRYYRKIKTSAQRNPESHSSVSNHIIPPKNNRLSKISNVAETNPMEFARILTEKLQRVLDEQNDREMMRSKLSAMSEDDGTTDDSHSILSSTTGGAGTTNTTLNQLLVAIQAGDHDAEAQDILDMHCKRIWERSGQHTPAKSPSRAKSPDHLQQHNAQSKRMLPRQAVSSTHSALPIPYNKQSAITASSKPLPGAAVLQYPMDSSYPISGLSSSQLYNNKSNSRHGMATFPTRAEQQSIFKPPPGVSTNNQKVVEWISRNEEILQHSNLHGPPESDKSSFKRSQRSGSTSASPRTIRSKTHSKGAALPDSKRITQDDKHSFKSKSTTSSGKDRRSMSRSAGDTSAMLGGGVGLQQTLTQRKGVPIPPQLKVAFFLLDEPIPYSVTVPGTEITLAKFKELITKKGNYRYFFKKATDDEFGRDVPYVLEEITNDNQILPKWEAKVVGHVKKVEQ